MRGTAVVDVLTLFLCRGPERSFLSVVGALALKMTARDAGVPLAVLSLSGWSSGGQNSWQPAGFCASASSSYQLLSVANASLQTAILARSRDAIFEMAQPEGTVRFRRAGIVSGHATLAAGMEASLVIGASSNAQLLPSVRENCHLPTAACGVCLDGFARADGNDGAGGGLVRQPAFRLRVAPQSLLALAALPTQFGAGVQPTGSLELRWEAACDLLAGEACASGGWAGLSRASPRAAAEEDPTGGGCRVVRATQLASELELRSAGCMLGRGGAPFAYRRWETPREFRAAVRLSSLSDVPWSSAGLLVAADGSGGARASSVPRSPSTWPSTWLFVGMQHPGPRLVVIAEVGGQPVLKREWVPRGGA